MRTAQVFSFVRRRIAPDWSAQDIAEFYRVEGILVQSGLQVTSARGLTDEGDPWFVFCRADDDEVIIHFARIDGRYVISSPAYCGNAAGYDFRGLVRDMIERHPVLRPKAGGDNLFLHPAALLVMLVASAFLKSGHAAEAAPGSGTATSTNSAAEPAADVKSRVAVAVAAGASAAAASVTLDASQEMLLLSAINVAIAASAPQHTITEAISPTPFIEHDAADLPTTASANAMVTDRPHDAPVMGSSGIGPMPSPQSVIVAPVDPASSEPAHSAPPGDTMTVRLSSVEVTHYQSPPDADASPVAMAPAVVTLEAVPSVHHVSPHGLSEIPHADRVLLQALGVPDSVAYAPSAPAEISTVIQAGIHTIALNGPSVSELSLEPEAEQANATPSIQESTNVPATIAGPAEAATQGATGPIAVPDIATVIRIVLAFEAVEAQPTVLLSDHGIIFYDAAAINFHYSEVRSVTYDFGDGFSISLVGLPVELTHAGAHV